MRNFRHAVFAVVLLPVLALLPLGCGDDDGSGPNVGDCGIEIYTPADGLTFFSGDDMNIRWHASGGGSVSVELLKGDAVVDTIAASTPNDGYYWFEADTRGETSGDNFAMRIASTSASGCADTVGFRLVNTVGCVFQMTSSAAALIEGGEYEVTWVSENTGDEVDVELWKGTLDRVYIATLASSIPDDGSFLWQNIDTYNQGTATDYTIRVRAVNAVDCYGSINNIRITDENICWFEVFAPAEDAVYNEGDSINIQFTGTNDSGTVNIALYVGAIFQGVIAEGVDGSTGSYNWVADKMGWDGASNVFRIRVSDVADPYCVGRTGAFTIN